MKNCLIMLIFIPFLVFGKDLPKWITSPMDYCSKEFLCAVGQGSGKLMAESSARNELAKIFKSEIKSSSKVIQQSTSTSTEDSPLSGSTEEEQTQFIEENVKEVIEGLEIVEVYEDSEGFYALAKLNKKQASDNLIRKMQNLDDQIKDLLKLNKRSSFFKSLKYWKQRELLNERYHILNERFYPNIFSQDEILKKIRQKRALNTVLFFEFKNSYDEVRHLLLQNFLDLGYRINENPKKTFDYKISASFRPIKQHLNVDGFERHKFNLNLISKNNSGTKIGGLNFSVIATGRSYSQCLENALVELGTFLENRIGELNID